MKGDRVDLVLVSLESPEKLGVFLFLYHMNLNFTNALTFVNLLQIYLKCKKRANMGKYEVSTEI